MALDVSVTRVEITDISITRFYLSDMISHIKSIGQKNHQSMLNHGNCTVECKVPYQQKRGPELGTT